MKKNIIRNATRVVAGVLSASIVLGIILSLGCQRPKPVSEPLNPAFKGAVDFETQGTAFTQLIRRELSKPNNQHILIDPGDGNETVNYYSEIGIYLGLPLVSQKVSGGQIINTNFTLDSLLQFCGYQDGQRTGLSAVDLDRLPGGTINDPALLGSAVPSPVPSGTAALKSGEILAATFFAPKICDVGRITGAVGASNTPPKYGWRKVVLLQPRDGSLAKMHQVAGVWVLFNYFVSPEAMANSSLIVSNSVNTQVMLAFDTIQNIPVNVSGQTADTNAAFWLDFNATAQGAQLNDALNATFDSGEPGWDPATARNYFVPTACAVCHGAERSNAALNMLDTDHWFERIRKEAPAGSDFAPMADSPNGVLLDGGRDLSTPTFANAFSIFQKLNEKISQQNHISGATVQAASVDHWLSSHATNSGPLSLAQRALGTPGTTWTEADSALLSHFDRYCYRCHNVISYNVFSKGDVLDVKRGILKRLTSHSMPQDRQLDDKVINTFTNLVGAAH